jgi:hypothetical protein
MSPSQRFFLALYVGLLLLCAALLVISNFLDPTVRSTLLPISSDGFKTVLGALLGAISVMLGNRST